jgi:hypothetical protein
MVKEVEREPTLCREERGHMVTQEARGWGRIKVTLFKQPVPVGTSSCSQLPFVPDLTHSHETALICSWRWSSGDLTTFHLAPPLRDSTTLIPPYCGQDCSTWTFMDRPHSCHSRWWRGLEAEEEAVWRVGTENICSIQENTCSSKLLPWEPFWTWNPPNFKGW